MSLFTRFYFIVGFSLILSFFVSLVILDNSLESEDGRLFTASARGESALLRKHTDVMQADLILKFIENYTPQLDVMVSAKTRDEILKYLDIERFDLNDSGFARSTESWETWWYVESLPVDGYFLLVEETDAPPAREDLLEFFIPFGSVFLFLGIGFYLLSSRMRKHLSELSATAKAIGGGQWQQRARLDVPEPIFSLSRDVNGMAEQLESTFREQQIAVGALPHEIRSPIARLRFAVGLLQSAKTDAEREAAMARVESYVDQLEETVEASLLLVRDQRDDLAQSEQLKASVLEQVLADHYSQLLDNSTNQALSLSIEVQGDELVHGHLQLLSQAVTNVVDNALHYASSRVHIFLDTSSEGGRITIEDDGPGIPEASREEVLAPFFRLDPSRTRQTGGVGLGLAITRKILLAHGGGISVLDARHGGASFELFWPSELPTDTV